MPEYFLTKTIFKEQYFILGDCIKSVYFYGRNKLRQSTNNLFKNGRCYFRAAMGR